MDAADALIKKIFSSVDLQTKCADKLDELANELEGTKKNVNTAKVVGSSLSVGGAAAMTAAGVATLFTGGAALPIIAMTSGAVSWVGLLTDATSDAVTFYQAKNTSEEAVKVVENIARLHDEIKDNMDSLRDEAKKKQQPYCSSGEDYVIEVILRGMAERNGLTLEGSVSLQKILEDHVGQSQTKRITSFLLLAKETATLIVIIEKSLTKLLQKATASAARETVKTAGGKTLRKAVGRIIGGVLGLAISVPELVYNVKKLDDCDTEASKSLRENAESIRTNSKRMKSDLQEIDNLFKGIKTVKRCVEDIERSGYDKKTSVKLAMKKCENEFTQLGLKESGAIAKFVNAFVLL